MVVPVSFSSWPTDAQPPPRRLSEDDAGVVQVHGTGTDPRTCGTPRRRAQSEFQAGWGGSGFRGRGEDRSVDGPGGGRDVNRVMRRPLGLVLVGGQKPQCGERPRVVRAWKGVGEAKEGQGDLGVSGQFGGTSRTDLTVGGLRGAGGLGGALRDGAGLWGVGRSLPSVRLSRRRKEEELEA